MQHRKPTELGGWYWDNVRIFVSSAPIPKVSGKWLQFSCKHCFIHYPSVVVVIILAVLWTKNTWSLGLWEPGVKSWQFWHLTLIHINIILYYYLVLYLWTKFLTDICLASGFFISNPFCLGLKNICYYPRYQLSTCSTCYKKVIILVSFLEYQISNEIM